MRYLFTAILLCAACFAADDSLTYTIDRVEQTVCVEVKIRMNLEISDLFTKAGVDAKALLEIVAAKVRAQVEKMLAKAKEEKLPDEKPRKSVEAAPTDAAVSASYFTNEPVLEIRNPVVSYFETGRQ